MGYLISRLTEFFGAEKAIQSIKRRDVQSFVRQRASSAAAGTIALEFGILTRILDVGVANEFISRNPATDVQRPQKVRRPLRSLTSSEFIRIQQASPRWLRVISSFCLATSLTQELAIKARWSSVNKRRGIVTLEVSKGGKQWVIPLNKLALDSLEKARANRSNSSDYIFQGPRGLRHQHQPGISESVQVCGHRQRRIISYAPRHGPRMGYWEKDCGSRDIAQPRKKQGAGELTD
jgi:integrase